MRLCFGMWLAMVACGGVAVTAPVAKPNIVVILSDDKGWGDLSLHGITDLKTPHLDSIELHSLTLTRCGSEWGRFHASP